MTNTTTASKYIPTKYLGRPESIEIPPFRPHYKFFPKTVSYEVNLASKCSPLEVILLNKSTSKHECCFVRFTSLEKVFENSMKWGLKGGFQLMQILGLLGMYFDAVVVDVEKSLLFFRLALAILTGWM